MMSTGADAPSTGTSLASDPPHPAPQRSLWIGGLSAEVSDELLQSRLEAVRARVAAAHTSSAGSRDFGSFAVRRMPEASGAWVDASDDLAQEIITVLNGTTLGPGAILVRYSRQVTSPSSSPSPSPKPNPDPEPNPNEVGAVLQLADIDVALFNYGLHYHTNPRTL